MNNETHFASILKDTLGNQNISDVARRLDIPKSLLHDWVHARRCPSLSSMHHVKKIADFIGVSFEEIILGESSSTSKTISTVTFDDNNAKYSITISKLKILRGKDE